MTTLSHTVENSSTIDRVQWLPSDEAASRDKPHLVIDFKSGGTYVFEGVPRKDYESLIAAESVGKHFHQHIRGKFPVLK